MKLYVRNSQCIWKKVSCWRFLIFAFHWIFQMILITTYPFGIGLFMVNNFEVLLEQAFPEHKNVIIQDISQKLEQLVFEVLEIPAKMMPRTDVFGMHQGEK